MRFSRTRTRTKDEEISLGPEDVLLVTGGGKGIAAECALAFARETGVKLAFVGRSDPKLDKELANNFARIAAAGVRSSYVRADVTDAAAVRAAVAEIERKLGPVTAVLHGAGVNTPQLIGALDETAFRRTVLPKVSGAEKCLDGGGGKKIEAAGHVRLDHRAHRLAGRGGLRDGERMARGGDAVNFRPTIPGAAVSRSNGRCGRASGMGERLGRMEMLAQQGITPITVDAGVRIFCESCGVRPSRAQQFPKATPRNVSSDSSNADVAAPEDGRTPQPTSLVVTGRFGELPTLKMIEPELPLLRFLERKRVFYPGVELVVDVEVSLSTDPYLADHAVQKQPLLPAVMGLEAMAQTAMALAGRRKCRFSRTWNFLRPMAVPEQNKLTIRLAALHRENGAVEVCLRSEETDFQVDHFRAVCRFAENAVQTSKSAVSRISKSARLENVEPHPPDERFADLEIGDTAGLETCATSVSIALDPQTDLYGRILFHRGRFQRLRGYRFVERQGVRGGNRGGRRRGLVRSVSAGRICPRQSGGARCGIARDSSVHSASQNFADRDRAPRRFSPRPGRAFCPRQGAAARRRQFHF